MKFFAHSAFPSYFALTPLDGSRPMRIKTLEFEDKTLGWKLSETHFDQLTLLVGASGVGKTRILRAIEKLVHISAGESFEGVCWKVDFETTKGTSFRWQGEFGMIDEENADWFEFRPEVLNELLEQQGVLLFRREGKKMPGSETKLKKVHKYQSAVSFLKEGWALDVRINFGQIMHNELVHRVNFQKDSSAEADFGDEVKPLDLQDIINLDTLFQKHLPPLKRLIFAFYRQFPAYQQIRTRFLQIFPMVQDIRFAPDEDEFDEDDPSPVEYHILSIKEQGSETWIEEDNISSGMLRTLVYLSEIYLSPPGSVILFDEFEKSLGINCINELTTDMLNADRSLQFIITSHHPYIINAIDFFHWKVVTRSGGVVKTLNATELNLGRSKHEAFMQLLQRPEYQTGTESERV